jgi:hypothetical protein
MTHFRRGNRSSARTKYFACCIRTDFSNAHHGGAVTKHKTRLKRLFKFRYVTVNETTVQTFQSNRSQFNEWHPVLLRVSISKKSSLDNSLKHIWNTSVL